MLAHFRKKSCSLSIPQIGVCLILLLFQRPAYHIIDHNVTRNTTLAKRTRQSVECIFHDLFSTRAEALSEYIGTGRRRFWLLHRPCATRKKQWQGIKQIHGLFCWDSPTTCLMVGLLVLDRLCGIVRCCIKNLAKNTLHWAMTSTSVNYLTALVWAIKHKLTNRDFKLLI